jgi:predicted metal-dependent phosphoesterase TrpH
MPRIDLHTHSIASPDGALRATDYTAMLASGRLNYIAVTDHNRIDFAVQLQAQLGPQIIVGEEITTTDGEIIGLYLHKAVPAGLSAAETVQRIHEQGGLVYIPHPFETVRKGITVATLDTIAAHVDIMEIHNGRTLQSRGQHATEWARAHRVAGAASSDAHGRRGWGKTCSIIDGPPSRIQLVSLLQQATYDPRSVGVLARLDPNFNRLRKPAPGHHSPKAGHAG